jgi:aminopeptidase-like protein
LSNKNIGSNIWDFCRELWPINRSITGEGVDQTLKKVQLHVPNLNIKKVPSGTNVFDWIVPKEWKIRNAWIKLPNGEKICDFKNNNLHIVGYSIPVHKKLSLTDLQKHLHSIPKQKKAIPYVTSYYKESWGFCISEEERNKLTEGEYEVYIDSELFNGNLTYGEVIIKGESKKEVLLSTYICHPSMANNELSGTSVLTFLTKWILSLKNKRYSYRIIFIPETIGSITYLSKNIDHLKKNVYAGFNITCIGDERAHSFLPSRKGDTISDQIAKHTLKAIDKNFIEYKWSDRGSDERQYCAPLIDLPIASIMRTKYGMYDEYHTSLDDLDNVVTPKGLEGGYWSIRRCIEGLENNYYPLVKILGEPQMSKRGLYPTTSNNIKSDEVKLLMDIISWSDGKKSLLDIAELCNVPIWKTYPFIEKLREHNLIKLLKAPLL